MLHYSLYISGTIFIIVFFYQVYRLLRDARKMQKFNHRKVFNMISRWYEYADISRTKQNSDTNKLISIETEIDKLLDTKVMKPSSLSFSEKFISEFLFAKQHTTEIKLDAILFERIARLDLKKTRQGLKIFSLAFGVKFTLENYSFVNFWTMLKGNHNIFSNNRTDQTNRKYTWQDIEEPFGVLKYYFEQ
ncbi:MAG: hypothetical protein PF638_05655 [Candidatus Delongbacteria bacterium]|jgi:hypothetical protein|nr:hypothetical protein [Candidatus Delongbacteria bacterium]